MKVLSPIKKRRAVFYFTEQLNVSEHRICRVLNEPRSTQRYCPKIRDGEEPLVAQMADLATKYCHYLINLVQ